MREEEADKGAEDEEDKGTEELALTDPEFEETGAWDLLLLDMMNNTGNNLKNKLAA